MKKCCQVAQTYEYDSFGNIANQNGNIENPFTYNGREYDAETGLYFYRARYYDAKAGRFTSEDPVGIIIKCTGKYNHLYTYVKNNPLKFTDGSGLMTSADYDRLHEKAVEEGDRLTRGSGCHGLVCLTAYNTDVSNCGYYMSNDDGGKSYWKCVETALSKLMKCLGK